jgi:hypothetical protein
MRQRMMEDLQIRNYAPATVRDPLDMVKTASTFLVER